VDSSLSLRHLNIEYEIASFHLVESRVCAEEQNRFKQELKDDERDLYDPFKVQRIGEKGKVKSKTKAKRTGIYTILPTLQS
jgi:hypothetical protein